MSEVPLHVLALSPSISSEPGLFSSPTLDDCLLHVQQVNLGKETVGQAD